MAVQLISPRYSFVQFNEAAPFICRDATFCLPINQAIDARFQFFLTATGDDLTRLTIGDAPNGAYIYFSFMPDCNIVTGSAIFPGALTIDYKGFLYALTVDDNADYSFVGRVNAVNAGNKLNATASASCLTLFAVYRTLDESGEPFQDVMLGCSNCFKKISDVCDTTSIQYQCNDNSFGFLFNTENFDAAALAVFNRVRLPIIVKDMEFDTDQRIYEKYNGSKVKLYSRINEVYEMQIDFVPDDVHRRIKVALESDTIQITTTNAGFTNAGIEINGEYEIDKLDVQFSATRSGRASIVRADALNLINSNCA